MVVYEKNNKLNINFNNSIEEVPNIQLGENDNNKTDIEIDGKSLNDSLLTTDSLVETTSEMTAEQKAEAKANLGIIDATAENIVDATAAMTQEQATQTRQNIGADTPATVTEWLDEHVDPDTGYVIDNSLTVKGAAADAKATGDAVGELKSALNENLLDKYVNVEPTNWYNPDEVESGEIYKDGSFHASTSRSHTGYIPCTEGDKLQIFRTAPISAAYRRHVAFYTANKVAMNLGSDSSNDVSITAPSGSAFAIMTFDNALISTTFNIIIVRDGIAPASYTPYFEPYTVLEEDFVTPETEQIINKVKDKELSTTDLINRYGCALPRNTLRQTIGLPEVWYFDNMGTPKGCEYSVTNVGNPLKRLNKGVQFGNTTAFTSSYGFYFSMYDILLNVIRQDKASGQGYPRRIVAENLSNCTVLAIGDSTIDSDYLTGGMLSYFDGKGKTLTLLGTLGDGSETNKNEGRSGWKASDYFTDKKYNGVTNPFYNPSTQTFDFSYYMTNQSYTTPDFVILQLGINDMYNSYSTDGIIESTYGYIKGMVDSILAYNGSIKVLINLPTPPNSDKSRHTNTEFLYWNTIIRYNDYALAQIKATYEESKVRCTYCHLILDPDTDIADTVHPTQDGYGKMAMEVINQINCWQNGV